MTASPTPEAAIERLGSLECGRLYSLREIGLLGETDLHGLLATYQLRGEHDLAEEVEIELEQRQIENEQAEVDEAEYEAEQDRKQRLHDEWLDATFG